MIANTRRVAGGILVLIGILVASPVSAHPKGQRPVLLVSRSGTGLRATWIIAADDAAALGTSLGLGPRRPTTFASEPSFVSYMRQRLVFTSGGGDDCELAVRGVDEVATGFAVTMEADCGVAPDAAVIANRLLLDLSTDYITMLEATTEAGPYRTAFTAAVPSLRVPFVGAHPTVEPGPDQDARGRLEGLIRGDIDVGFVIAFGLAILLGMVHGLTPGHGKTLAAAYLAGSRGTMRQAAMLAGIVTLAHGASTLVLAGMAASVNKYLPEQIVPWLEGATALLAFGVGVALLRGRTVSTHRHADAENHDHDHSSGDEHEHDTSAGPVAVLTKRRLLAIGLVGGLIPGPEAFAVGFLAVAEGRVALGIALITAFSVGLGLVVFAVAGIAVAAGRVVKGNGRIAALAPRVAGLVFIAVAVMLGIRALS